MSHPTNLIAGYRRALDVRRQRDHLWAYQGVLGSRRQAALESAHSIVEIEEQPAITMPENPNE